MFLIPKIIFPDPVYRKGTFLLEVAMLLNNRGISVHAFEFSLAENLSAQHMD